VKPGFLKLLQGALIAAATLVAFQPAVQGFYLWDDVLEITRNRLIRDPHGLVRIWLGRGGLDYLPLKSTVQWIQWHLWGDAVAGYHLTNIGLHLAGALLLWRVLAKLGVRLAWLGGLVFAVHPLTVESVAWISELKNVLSLPFLLLAIAAYIDWDQGERANGAHLYLTALACFLASLLCKASGVMLPFVLLLYCWWKRGRVGWRDFEASLPFLALSLLASVVTIWFQFHRAIHDLVISQGGGLSRAAIAGLSAVFYLSKAVWPAGLLPNYPRWSANPPALWQFWPWLVIGGAVLSLWLLGRSEGRDGESAIPWSRHLLFGLGFFLINLVPVLGFVPMSYLRFSWVADHLAYLPLAGMAGLVAAGVGALTPSRWMLGGLVAAVVAALVLTSRDQAAFFRDEETLWGRTLERAPGSWLALNNLGDIYFRTGRATRAQAYFEEAVRLNPDYPEAHDNLGVALVAAGRVDEGIRHYREALRLKPDFPRADVNLGIALCNSGRQAEAIPILERALDSEPDYAEAHNDLGVCLVATGRFREALAQFREALRLNPGMREARNNIEFTLGRLRAGR
jgi:cytochrome c-type biogenesis protein CcmH/NrfG